MKADAPRVAALVLAAGRSSRMRGGNKLLAEIDGIPLVARAVDTVLATPVRPVLVVTGRDADRIRAALAGRELRFVENAAYAEGLGGSIAAGARAAPRGIDGLFVCLGDMPRIRPRHLEALAAAFESSRRRAICVPVHGERRGHPVLFPADLVAELERLRGDRGARRLLDEHADRVREVPVADPGVLFDVDGRDQLEELRSVGR